MTAPAPGRNLLQIRDPQLALVLGAIDLPTGWTGQSGVEWHPDWPSNPVISWARVADPTANVGVDFLPAQSYAWVEPNPGLAPPGTFWAGQTSLRPAPAAATLAGWVVPKLRGPQALVVSSGPEPELATKLSVPPDPGVTFEGASARVEVDQYSEQWLGLAYYRSEPPQYGPMGPLTQVSWGFYRLLVLRAPTGTLDEHSETLWSVVRSLRVNPEWEQRGRETIQNIQQGARMQMAQGYATIAAAGQISRQISAGNDAMIAGMDAGRAAQHLADAARRQQEPAARDQTAGFDDYIRGVQTDTDPYGGTSQHDADAAYVWTDGSGQYRTSSDPFFDPNIGTGGGVGWTIMTPAR